MNNLNNFIGVIIKPDSLKLGLEYSIKQDLIRDAFKIKLEKVMQITTEQVPYVYPDKINTDRYTFSHYSITHGEAIILILERENSYEKFSKLKGNTNCKGGLREKYRNYTKEGLIKLGLSGPALEYELCKNIIHGSENLNETILMLIGLLNKDEIEGISTFSNLLYINILRQLTILKGV